MLYYVMKSRSGHAS